VSDWIPVAAKLVTQVATPDPLRAWAEQPVMEVPPFLKLMVPVGVTPPPVTVAVRVVDWLTEAGLGDALSAVADVPALTVREAEPVDAALLTSPE
jgi:hypothetical protein